MNRSSVVVSAPEDPDQAVPAHLGDPDREQTALAEGRAVCVLARDVATVAGPDRLSWPTTLSSQVPTGLKPGDGGTGMLFLDAQSHIAHTLVTLDDGRMFWFITEAGRGEALAAFLNSIRFMLRVEVTERPDVMASGTLGKGPEVLVQVARDTAPDAPDSPTETGDAELQGSLIGL